ncbi:MAG TPA: hypothetical protein VIQ05_15990 [Tardiphaga sp.]
MVAPDQTQLKFRVDEYLREELEKAAAANGVSLNKEINERLLTSLNPYAPMLNSTSSPLMKLLVEIMQTTGELVLFQQPKNLRKTGGDWIDDGFAYDQAVAAAITVLKAFRPTAPGDDRMAQLNSMDGIFWGEHWLQRLAAGDPTNAENVDPMFQAFREELGPELLSRISHMAEFDVDASAKSRFAEKQKGAGR